MREKSAASSSFERWPDQHKDQQDHAVPRRGARKVNNMMANESGLIKLMLFVLVYMSNRLVVSCLDSQVVDSSQASKTTNTTQTTSKHLQSSLSNLDRAAQPTNRTTFDESSRPQAAIVVPHEQKLALKIMYSDKPAPKRKSSPDKANRAEYNLVELSHKRPYDLPSLDNNLIIDKSISPLGRHFYLLDQSNKSSAYDPPPTSQPGQLEQLLDSRNYRIQWAPKRRPTPASQRNELIRNQHRPPWHWQHGHHRPDARVEFLGKKYKIKRLTVTTVPPQSLTTTEFFKLISSAHSPDKLAIYDVQAASDAANNSRAASEDYQLHYGANDHSDFNYQVNRLNHQPLRTTTTTTTTTSFPRIIKTQYGPNGLDGRVISSAIVVSDGPGDKLIGSHDNILLSGNRKEFNELGLNNTGGYLAGERRFNFTLGPDEVPVTVLGGHGKRPVTIIRHSPRITTTTTTTTTTTAAPSSLMVVPDKIKIQDNLIDNSTLTTTADLPHLVRLISKQKHKYDDNVISPTLTVVDNDAIRLPPNATSVHNNKLIVAIRPGRPQRRHPSTTQFPVYNIVAGITPPYSANPTRGPQFTRPTNDGSQYGLLTPNVSIAETTVIPSSMFGAPNIKFPAPAPAPTNIQVDHVEIPDRLNISVPESANMSGPNRIPDRIILDSGDQHSRPHNSIVTSDRPHADVTMKFSTTTTKRPQRVSTTKRINIVSANTTVITTNPDELHDVLSTVIAGAHQDNIHHINQSNKPTSKPGIMASLSNLLNAGVTTSTLAILTLLKSIFVAILVMFLPPLALTTAIMQAVSMG